MFFSIVIPLYNKEKSISRTINSVLQQTHTDFELIIIDDGSTDRSAEVVAAFSDPRIVLVRQRNQGESVARNEGINKAKSEYICLLDADDEWYPHFLHRIAQLISQDGSAGMYSCRFDTILPDGSRALGPLGINPNHRGVVKDFFTAYRKSRSMLNASSVCVRKSAIQEVGGFPVGEQRGEDAYVWLLMAQRYPVMFDATVSSTYYQNAENRTGSRLAPQIPYSIKGFLQPVPPRDLDEGLLSYLKWTALAHAISAVEMGHRDLAIEYARLLRPYDWKYAAFCFAVTYVPREVLRLLAKLRASRRRKAAASR